MFHLNPLIANDYLSMSYNPQGQVVRSIVLLSTKMARICTVCLTPFASEVSSEHDPELCQQHKGNLGHSAVDPVTGRYICYICCKPVDPNIHPGHMATHTLIQHMFAGSAYQNIEWVKTIPSTFLDEKAFDYPLN